MRTVNCKHLELFSCDATHPAGRVRRLAIGGHDIWILKRSQPCFAFRKFTDLPKWHPREVTVGTTTSNRGEKKSHNRYGHGARSKSIEYNSQLHEEPAPRNRGIGRRGKCRFCSHCSTPSVARYSRQNKVDRDSGRGETPAMPLRRLFPGRTLASQARFRASRALPTPVGPQSSS